jgi:hypothetical protein
LEESLMQEFVRQELLYLGLTEQQIREMEQASARVTDHMKRGGVTWSKDAGTNEIVFHWAHYDDCHEVWVPFSKRFPARDYVSEWELKTQYRLTPKQRQQLGQYHMTAERANARGTMVPTFWWRRETVEAVITPKPHVQGNLF